MTEKKKPMSFVRVVCLGDVSENRARDWFEISLTDFSIGPDEKLSMSISIFSSSRGGSWVALLLRAVSLWSLSPPLP